MATSNITVTALNGVKVYNLTSGKTLPEWLAEGKKTALRKDLGKNKINGAAVIASCCVNAGSRQSG